MWAFLMVGCAANGGGALAPEHLEADRPPTDRENDEEEVGLLFGDEVHDVRLTFEPEAIARLATTADEAKDAPYVAALFHMGEVTYPVTLRLKGGNGSFRPFSGKPSFRIDFAGREADRRFDGSRWLILNNLVQDPSMLGEHLAYGVYGALDLPASRHGYARLSVNGEPFGLYGVVEPVEHDMIARLWPADADGLLVEGGADAVLDSVEDFEVVQQGGLAPLVNALAAVGAASPEAYLDTLDAWFDADRLLDVWAVEIATGNPDGYVARHNNYFLYWKESDESWVMLPWGTDTAFSEPLGWRTPDDQGQLYLDCLAAPACEAALRERLAAIATWWGTDVLQAAHGAAAEATQADCLADPRSEAGPAGCAASRAALTDFVQGRRAALLALLGD